LCTSLTRDGKACRNRALHDSDPPVCSNHGGRTRTSALTVDVHARFISLLRASNAFDTCARAVGVSPQTAKGWYRQGSTRDAVEPFRAFRLDVDRAEAEAEARAVAIIAKAASDSWQAAAWLLERQHPERWARVSQREKAAELKEPEKPHDPFSEADELAQRRRHA
jgi:hypothetical protein